MNTALAGLTVLLLSLVHNLGSRDFRARERAHRALASYGELAWSAVIAGEGATDPEVACRCGQLVKVLRCRHAWELSANYKPTRYPLTPWLCLRGTNVWDPPYGDVCRHYRLRAQVERKASVLGPEFDDWRVATRLWVADRITAGWRDMEIVAALDDMAAQEVAWIQEKQRECAAAGTPCPHRLPAGYKP